MIRHINKIVWIAGILIAAVVMGCGGAKTGDTTSQKAKLDEDGRSILSKEAKEDFEKTATEFKTIQKEGWNEGNCDRMAKHFEDVADEHSMPEAAYNVGVVYERCGKLDKAKSAFESAMKKFSDSVPTKQLCLTHLAIMDIDTGKDNDAEAKLKEAVGLGRNTLEAVPAYTIAATLLREKAKAGDKEAWAKAQKALRTALAIDAKYMPALYQLTMLYFDIAVTLNKPSYLTLASLVFDQAVKTDPEFAPIYHALGRIQLQKNELVESLKAFERAFQKDPNLFEAYMSFAAINLNFRGYEDAKKAFEKAIEIRPNSYDAHMGLGVAARGLGDFALARAEYKKASEIDKARTDYIFNLGLLEMDYENDGTPAGFAKAQKVFEKFIKHATKEHQEDPDGKRGPQLSWVAKAEKRIATCKKAIEDIKQAEKEMAELKKLQEEQEKAAKELAEQQKRAEELAAKEAEGASAPAEGDAVDEAAVEAELAAEEKAAAEKAKAEQDAVKEKEQADKAAEEQSTEQKDAEKKSKGDVDLD